MKFKQAPATIRYTRTQLKAFTPSAWLGNLEDILSETAGYFEERNFTGYRIYTPAGWDKRQLTLMRKDIRAIGGGKLLVLTPGTTIAFVPQKVCRFLTAYCQQLKISFQFA